MTFLGHAYWACSDRPFQTARLAREAHCSRALSKLLLRSGVASYESRTSRDA